MLIPSGKLSHTEDVRGGVKFDRTVWVGKMPVTSYEGS